MLKREGKVKGNIATMSIVCNISLFLIHYYDILRICTVSSCILSSAIKKLDAVEGKNKAEHSMLF